MDQRDDTRTLEVLFEISQAVSQTRDLEELYLFIHKALDKILTVDNFYIALYHEDRDAISFPYHVDENNEIPDEILNFSRTASLTGKVIAMQKPLIFYEQDILDFAKAQNQKVIGSVSKVWLGAPLIIQKRVIGVIAIQSFDSADAYVEKDLDLLNTMSQHIALAIERKEFERELRDQQALLETILESSPVGICLIENRIFKWVNNQMVRMLGYESKLELTEQALAMIYPERGADDRAREMNQQGRADFDLELKRRDGSLLKVHMILTGSDQGRTIAIIADISHLERAHKERMEKERLQGVLEMAGAVCHEINQPLQSILGYTELFESLESISPDALNQIRSQAARIGRITRQLAKITRYETISYPGDATIVDIWRSSS